MASTPAVAAGCVSITLAALFLSLAFCPPIAAALHLPGRLLRATNVRAGRGAAGALAAPLGLVAFAALDPAHPVAGAWAASAGPSPSVLAWRAAGVCLGLVSLIVNATTGAGLGPPRSWFTWYTNLSFLQLWAAAALGAWVSGRAVWAERRKRRAAAADPPPLKEEGGGDACPATAWRLSQRAHVLGMAVAAPNAVFLSVFYWAALYAADARARGGGPPYPDSILKHGATAAWAVVDTLLSRTPGASPHFPALAGWAGAYLIFMWAWKAGTGRWVYAVLDWSHGPAVIGVYAALPALLAACTLALYGLAAGREAGRRWLERRWGGRAGAVGSAGGAAAAAAAV